MKQILNSYEYVGHDGDRIVMTYDKDFGWEVDCYKMTPELIEVFDCTRYFPDTKRKERKRIAGVLLKYPHRINKPRRVE